MANLDTTAHAFIEMAHRIVWASVATVDRQGRPRSRILHPYWSWSQEQLTGWIATSPTPVKLAHIEHSPFASVSYWGANTDTCTADCSVEWIFDDETRIRVWDMFKSAPPPVGYDPAVVPPWRDGPTSTEFAAWRLAPWRLRVMPGTVLTQQVGEILTWRAA